jgi:two-component system response regulator MprA
MTGTLNRQARILVVEDERSILSAIRRGMAFEGYLVEAAETGTQALDIVRDRMPDLIVLDIMLPGIDGIEVCRRIRAAGEDVPILMLTARDEIQDRVAGLDAGDSRSRSCWPAFARSCGGWNVRTTTGWPARCSSSTI